MQLTTSDCTPTRLCLSLGPPLGGKQGKVIFLRMDVPVFERMIQVASTALVHSSMVKLHTPLIRSGNVYLLILTLITSQ